MSISNNTSILTRSSPSIEKQFWISWIILVNCRLNNQTIWCNVAEQQLVRSLQFEDSTTLLIIIDEVKGWCWGGGVLIRTFNYERALNTLNQLFPTLCCLKVSLKSSSSSSCLQVVKERSRLKIIAIAERKKTTFLRLFIQESSLTVRSYPLSSSCMIKDPWRSPSTDVSNN